MNLSRRENRVYLDISDGLETAEVPRVLFAGVYQKILSDLRESMTNDIVVFNLFHIVNDLSKFCGG